MGLLNAQLLLNDIKLENDKFKSGIRMSPE
jgi:hypothetical protein